jgi:hypothetical protein
MFILLDLHKTRYNSLSSTYFIKIKITYTVKYHISHCFIAYVSCLIANPAKLIRIILVCSWNDIHTIFSKVQFSWKCVWLIWMSFLKHLFLYLFPYIYCAKELVYITYKKCKEVNYEKITETKHEWKNQNARVLAYMLSHILMQYSSLFLQIHLRWIKQK